jgi:hypothetical protein
MICSQCGNNVAEGAAACSRCGAYAFASVSWGWSFGAFVGLIAAVVAVAPLGLPFLRSRTGR